MANEPYSKRQFLGTATLGLLSVSPLGALAATRRETLTAVEWGGTWLDSSKALLADRGRFDVNWVLHTGGSAAIVPKIKAGLPRISYDIVHSFPPVTYAMLQEGWLEPLTFEDMPSLRDVPAKFLTRNTQNQIINCPTSSIGAFWGYRADLTNKPVRTADDLFDPRLKGKICALSPTLQSGRFLLSLAIERGGNERDIDPGFAFAKELAKTGNIGRVAKSDVDMVNSITSGETAVAFSSLPTWSKIAQNQNVKYIIKQPDSHGMFKIFISQEEWVALQGAPNAKAAKDFMNWFISPAIHERYCELMGILPINIKSAPPKNLMYFRMDNEEDRKRYEYYPDYPYISTQLKSWNERWESEIVPLL